MIELQMLNKLLADNTLNPLVVHGITDEYFVVYKQEYEFIVEHYTEYNQMPDKETLIDKFNDFDFIEVKESWQYLVDTINEQNAFNRLVPIIKEGASIAELNSIDALEFLETEIEKLKNQTIKQEMGADIIKNVSDRVKEFESRLDRGGMLGISTGLKALDDVMYGMLPGEELITILGRPNQGKSWVMQYLLTSAWKQGKRVLHYSGEMGQHLVGFRFDTLNAHFSNMALMKGKPEVKDEYIEYGKNLEGEPYIVVTPQNLGGELLTSRSLERLIELYNPDIIGIDQLTLMHDIRQQRGDGQPAKLGHITQDLFGISEKYGIPIIAPHQAKRGSSKKDDEDTPGIDDSYGSDGIEQNSSRILGIRQVDVGIKITISKNRYGENNRDFIFNWDIDKGIITDTPVVERSENDSTEDGTDLGYAEGADLF